MKASAADLWSGIALAALGTFIISEAWHWDYLTPEGPGAGFFPLWYGIAMVSLSLVLVFSNLNAKPQIDWKSTVRALSVWLALAVSVALFKLLGFVLGFALFTFFVAAGLYRRPPAIAAAVAAALSAGFYAVFALALGIALPTGVLGF